MKNNPYLIYLSYTFFTIYFVAEYIMNSLISLPMLGMILLMFPKVLWSFDNDLKNNDTFKIFNKVCDYAGKGIIILFVLQVIYKISKINGYL